jgi:hypothetical protein
VSGARAKPAPSFPPWPRCTCGGPAAPRGEPRLSVTLDVDTRPERNVRAKWATIGRTQRTRAAIEEALSPLDVAAILDELRARGPWYVRLTRLSPGAPDDDGLPDALKAARDTVAAALHLGAPRDDARGGIAFVYRGERRKGAIGLRVEIWGPEGRQLPLPFEAEAPPAPPRRRAGAEPLRQEPLFREERRP